jgi:CO/xanthine dehydrogenase FAD-binding subunit
MLGRLPSFDYYRPTTIAEALNTIERLDGNVSILAGGTDLVAAMKEHRGKHPPLVDVKRIAELGGIRADDGALSIGATATAREIAASPLVRERFPMLTDALKILGSMQIGNRATIGGNLANASPAADSAPPLLALNASVRLVAKPKERSVPLDQFFVAPKKTVLGQELVASVIIPPAPRGWGVFYKLGQRNAPEDISIVSVAVFAVPAAVDAAWQEIRVALGAVAPTPIRALHTEERLRGYPLDAKVIDEAARTAAEKDAHPISDIRGSAEYRRAMIRVLVKRALEQIARAAQGTIAA